MAPVRSKCLGVTPHTMDNPELKSLLDCLMDVVLIEDVVPTERDNGAPAQHEIPPLNVSQLVTIVDKHPKWRFEELVDLNEWVHPLNLIDAALSHLVKKNPGLLLIEPVKRMTQESRELESDGKPKNEESETTFAVSLEDVTSVPESITKWICSLLRFLASLLKNSTNKSIFNSVDEVADLLAAADDTVASLALDVFAALAMPPPLYKQQSADGHQHSTSLHTSTSTTHKRLIALARGWGSRGTGLGLFTCVTADNSEMGQGILPEEAGEIVFRYFAAPSTRSSSDDVQFMVTDSDAAFSSDDQEGIMESCLATIHVSSSEIILSPTDVDGAMKGEVAVVNKQKRRRTGSPGTSAQEGMRTRSTAELFFLCLSKACGRSKIPKDRLFPLLADIRLARSFHSVKARVDAVERRLMALIATLHANPSQEVMSGYFQAQPELCVELIDLVRPTVASTTVASGASGNDLLRSLRVLADPPEVPYKIRGLAVEALTALVARRDGAGGLTGVARQSNVLNELGIGKGLYLGLLPTLIRYTLASINAFLMQPPAAATKSPGETDFDAGSDTETVALEMGLAFVDATRREPLPPHEVMDRALEFSDAVLTLASSVISAPTGTASLTESGLIPALLEVVKLESQAGKTEFFKSMQRLPQELSRSHAQLRFVSAQAIQILEGAIVTHNNALSTFHDLRGLDILVDRLNSEIVCVKVNSGRYDKKDRVDESSSEMECEPIYKQKNDGAPEVKNDGGLCSSRRILLFSLVNCLSVVFHQETNSSASTTAASSGGAQLRKPELSSCLVDILENVRTYGGVLTSLVVTLLSDIMNNDPHVVWHVHSSGIAKAFFQMISAEEKSIKSGKEISPPLLPPIPELIMALPNLLSALALTTEGAKKVEETNPFPSLMKIFYHAKYAMPHSKCFQHEMAAIIGTGLDEVMRHVPSLRQSIITAIVGALEKVVLIGKELVGREGNHHVIEESLESERVCLMQYASNIGQMLEHVLHSEEQCTSFVQMGGADAMIELYQYLMPTGVEFLANSSCLSAPSVCALSHTTTEETLRVAFKCIVMYVEPQKILKQLSKVLHADLSKVTEFQDALRLSTNSEGEEGKGVIGLIDGIPDVPLYLLKDDEKSGKMLSSISSYLRSLATFQWHTSLLGVAIRAASQRNQEGGSGGWGRSEREWKKEVSSPAFGDLINKMCTYQQDSLLESCRYRSRDEFESKYRERQRTRSEQNIRYKLRIVCQEGAVVRDGIEIDSCANVGSMDMGETAVAYDRCLNSSGVMRYRTRRGWVSELTRGHGREAISEVVDIWEDKDGAPVPTKYRDGRKTRVEFAVSSLPYVVSSILARFQNNYVDLMCALNKVMSHGVRAFPQESDQVSVGDHVQKLMRLITSVIQRGFNQASISQLLNGVGQPKVNNTCAGLYLAVLLGHFHSCAFEEKRDRRIANTPLLLHFFEDNACSVTSFDNDKKMIDSDEDESNAGNIGIIDALLAVFSHVLESVSTAKDLRTSEDAPHQRVSCRSVAACVPPAVLLLKRLMAGSQIKSSPLTAVLSRLEAKDLQRLLCLGSQRQFDQSVFTSKVQLSTARCVETIWKDKRFSALPSHVLYPMTGLATDVFDGLEEAVQPGPTSTETEENSEGGFFGHISRMRQRSEESGRNEQSQPFEASEEAVEQMVEMGFTRDRAYDAIESTESNRVEIAMEYTLSHPPPSPETLERRRTEREERRRRREEQARQTSQENQRQESSESETGANSSTGEIGALGTPAVDKKGSEKEEITAKAKSCLDSFKTTAADMSMNLLSRPVAGDQLSVFDGNGDAETEATTVVVSSFLLYLCRRYKDKRELIAQSLISCMKDHLLEMGDTTPPQVVVPAGKESGFGSLCHSLVLFVRGIPSARVQVIKMGLVHRTVSLVQQFIQIASSTADKSRFSWPPWLAPSLLLLDVMAQPVAALRDDDEDQMEEDSHGSSIGKGEFSLVREEHAKLAVTQCNVAKEIFSHVLAPSQNTKDGSATDGNMADGGAAADGVGTSQTNPKKAASELFSDFPGYFPLIPSSLWDQCVQLCLDLICAGDQNSFDKSCLPPGVVQACLCLLTRLSRVRSAASMCMREGAVEALLVLSKNSRFAGCAGSAAVFLRRLLEDEATLQASMETEIRSVLLKLDKKQNRSRSSTDQPYTNLSSLMKALTPLVCRDALIFFKAIAVTVGFDVQSPGASSQSRRVVVKLLSAEQRSLNLRVLNDFAPAAESAVPKQTVSSGKKGKNPSVMRTARGKSPGKKSSSRKQKKERSDGNERRGSSTFETPANHVTSLLISRVFDLCSEGLVSPDDSMGEGSSMLWTADILEILADLVLAIPSCAATIHKFRPKFKIQRFGGSTGLNNALVGCPSPPKTFVSFLLHHLLPQDRWSFKKDTNLWDRRYRGNNSLRRQKSKEFYVKSRVAQSTARLLVALVARAGEGRRRVVEDLVFALNGGGSHAPDELTTDDTEVPSNRRDVKKEHCALQAWGDLCIGLAAPRSNGVNHDSNSSLSFEVVRVMLESGMSHALAKGLRHVDLLHPMAPSTCASLLVPMEVFTRGSVADTISTMIKKDNATKALEKRSNRKKAERNSLSSQRSESAFADDAMLEDGFDAETAARSARSSSFGLDDDNNDAHGSVEDAEFEGNEDETMDELEMDDQPRNSDSEDDDDDDDDDEEEEDSDEDVSSNGSDAESNEEDENSEDESVEEGDEEEIFEDEARLQDIGGEYENGWSQDSRGDYFGGTGNLEDGIDANGMGLVVQGGLGAEVEEGWTSIEPSGLENVVYSSGIRRFGQIQHHRPRGFLDAAEAMIGSLLRTGEVQPEAIAQLEGSLGIRITSNGGESRGVEGGESWGSSTGLSNPLGNRPTVQNDGIGAFPQVTQRNPPDFGYGGRWAEISPLEFVYGGPSVASGNRNYDVGSSTTADCDELSTYPQPSAVDSQLFPGGPAAATHARPRQFLHPLLCGIHLPPVNALVSDLRPHGERARRVGQHPLRRPGSIMSFPSFPGAFLASTSDGGIARTTRMPFTDLPSQPESGLVGWTDDGLPLDASITGFSVAVERVLGDIAAFSYHQPASTLGSSNGGMENGSNVDEAAATSGQDAMRTDDDGNNTQDLSGNEDRRAPDTRAVPQDEREIFASGEEATRADGDVVASSLATGLRLSPGSSGSDAMSTTEQEECTRDRESSAAQNVNTAQAASTGETRNTENEALATVVVSNSSGRQVRDDAEPQGENELVCPPGMDLEVFNSLPQDMQREVVGQHQTPAQVAAQLDAASGLDPEVLAALPEDMRREAIAQERLERARNEQAPADPSNAEDMDNASFLVSLTPELREEILLTADEAFLSSLPPNIVAEAQIIRERASLQHRRIHDDLSQPMALQRARQNNGGDENGNEGSAGVSSSPRKRPRFGKIKVDCDRDQIVDLPRIGTKNSEHAPIGADELQKLLSLMFLLSPVRPQRLFHQVLQNLCENRTLRAVITSLFTVLLDDRASLSTAIVSTLGGKVNHDFPPESLIGAAPEVLDSGCHFAQGYLSLKRKGRSDTESTPEDPAKPSLTEVQIPPVVSSRIIEALSYLGKNSPRVCIDILGNAMAGVSGPQQGSSPRTCFEALVDLVKEPRYTRSSTNLEELLKMIEIFVSPMHALPRVEGEENEVPNREVAAAAASGKEWLDVPRVAISQERLKSLCSILRLESCRDATFSKVNSIARRLCQVEANRGHLLSELASVAQALGEDAIREMKVLRLRLEEAVAAKNAVTPTEGDNHGVKGGTKDSPSDRPKGSSSVALSNSSCELKLLRVLQTLQSLCSDTGEEQLGRVNDHLYASQELVEILQGINLSMLWEQLTGCLKNVKVLEGVTSTEEIEDKSGGDYDDNNESADEDGTENGDGSASVKKLKNSAAGLLTRFLPSIESFFVVNASTMHPETNSTGNTGDSTDQYMGRQEAITGKSSQSLPPERELKSLIGGKRVIDFVAENRMLLNALVRGNASLLDKGLKSMVQVSHLRGFLDFDVKRQWFKTQIRRLRQPASRRHGNLRLTVRRNYVFEDTYHHLRLRNADEMRGRLHITFRNEEGVDAGGLSREFFGILAREMFNPNYALFTSTEDGCTFQPNPNSSINPDHLSYFRFVGRIVGKAVADGFLLDAHFTRSLYKHMLGLEPTHHDMEAIDPDYYKNLKMILEHSLSEIGLDLTFSIEEHSFGRSQIVNLIPNGHNIPVTDETKARYVSLVCQNRMTTAISSQIKAYLDGFYELVSRDLIAIFTPRELELLISGLPNIDIMDLMENTEYNGYKATDPEIEWFWNTMVSLSRSQKAAFLQFVTGSSKVPLGGFSQLQGMRGVQKFSIHKVGGSSGALMSAHTCFNSLDLPGYKGEAELREKLLYAISEGQGAFMFA